MPFLLGKLLKKNLHCDDKFYLYSPGESLSGRAHRRFPNTEFKCKYDANEHILSGGSSSCAPHPYFQCPCSCVTVNVTARRNWFEKLKTICLLQK